MCQLIAHDWYTHIIVHARVVLYNVVPHSRMRQSLHKFIKCGGIGKSFKKKVRNGIKRYAHFQKMCTLQIVAFKITLNGVLTRIPNLWEEWTDIRGICGIRGSCIRDR